MKDNDTIHDYVEDCLMGMPSSYSVLSTTGESRLFHVWPLTLGKSFLVGRIMRSVCVNMKAMSANRYAESLRICQSYRDKVVKMLALYDCHTYEDHFDKDRIDEACSYLGKNLDDKELASLFFAVITNDKHDSIVKYYELDIDAENKDKVASVKGDRNSSLSFGGRSIYGAFVSFFIDKGMSIKQIVWEESYINLRLLMEDAPMSVYLSKEERRRVHIRARKSEKIMADDPKNARLIAEMINGGK